MFDMLAELDALHRAVAKDATGESVAVTVSRTYDADADDVWDALTNPDRLARWFSKVTGDLAVGGTFQFEANAGGEIRRCDRPTALEVTFGSPDSVVALHLAGADGGTLLRLVHTVPLAMAQSGAGALYPGPGWDGALLGLAIHLRGESVGDPLEAANRPEVVEFNKGSIDRWVAAIEASGTATADEVAAAREMAWQQYAVVPE